MRRVLQLVTLALLAGYTAFAQDLANKIPEKALAVASIKSDQLFRLFSTGEFNTSAFGQRLSENFSKRTGGSYKSIEDAGFNLSSTIYYYYHKTDSISYHCLLIPLSDASKLEQLFNDTTRAAIKHQGQTRTLVTSGRNLMMWNNEMLYIAHGSVDAYFFNDSLTAARYSIPQLPAEDGYTYSDEPQVDTTPYAYPVIDTVVTEDIPEPAADTVIEYEEDIAPVETEYDIAVQQQQTTKDSIAAGWMITYATDILNKSYPSILNNPAYVRSLDKDALGTFWMAELQRLYSGYLPYGLMKYGNMFRGYGSINAHLYMDKEHMRITGEMALDADKADAYKKIYDQKLNKQFLKYIKSDSLIGFMSYALNTEAYLNALPKIFSDSYASYGEEIDLGSDLISLMLDEKAIAKVIKGDALIIMTNISSKETTYNTYVYDENYERKDTVQTKTETLPDVLCMFSSDDTRIIEKLLKYGINKHKIRFENNIYSLNQSSKYPFSLHMLLKDGIVFLGTSLTDIEQINAGTFKGNLDKQQKELLLNNNMTMFFSPKNLRNKIPAVEPANLSESISNLLGNSGNVYLKSSGIKGNYVSAEFVADVPTNQDNALKYFFYLFNEVTKIK